MTAAEEVAPIHVEQGWLQGTSEGQLTVYRGIPFAAPPVGERRWRSPVPAEKWSGVRKAEHFSLSPVQSWKPKNETSEDCLYLNVWSPARTPEDKLPVLVWIYGGGFAGGSASEEMYTGEKLAQKGVVFVSFNYRVGMLGFLAHPELTTESPDHVSGNYGLLDQIAALKWIRNNIAAFGGDPDKITIFGESAGGISVSILCASPLAKGLFRGAISESGGSFGPTRPTTYPGENLKRLQEAERAGQEFAHSSGATSIADLRKMPADKLPALGVGAGWPTIDGYLIPDDQYKLYSTGKYNATPILVGYNSDEGASFGPPKTPADYKASVKARFGKFADALIDAYPTEKNFVSKSARDLTRDAAFGWPTWTWARLQATTTESKVFLYYFDQHPQNLPGTEHAGYGAMHGAEVAFVFQHLDGNLLGSRPADREISEAMATYWTNFAKFGDPNGPTVPLWKPFTSSSAQAMYFQQTAHAGPIPDVKGLKTLDTYFAWRRTPEGEAWAK